MAMPTPPGQEHRADGDRDCTQQQGNCKRRILGSTWDRAIVQARAGVQRRRGSHPRSPMRCDPAQELVFQTPSFDATVTKMRHRWPAAGLMPDGHGR
jgi:hypothetical protein